MTTKDDIFLAPPDGFPLEPVHPGEVLQDELAARRLTANALALKLRVPANRLTEILNGKRGISPDTALRLSRCLRTQRWVLAGVAEPVRSGASGKAVWRQDPGRSGVSGVTASRPERGKLRRATSRLQPRRRETISAYSAARLPPLAFRASTGFRYWPV